jgi:hypothetical protein
MEQNAIKQFFSRRAIIIGGPALANDATDEEVETLLSAVRQHLQSQAIYIETRNFNDYSRWKDVLSQINTENSLAEQIRQHNEQMALQREQFAWQKAQAAAKSSGGSSRSSSGSRKSSGGTSSVALTETPVQEESVDISKFKGAFAPLDANPNNEKAKEWARKAIDSGVNSDKILKSEANALFKHYNL